MPQISRVSSTAFDAQPPDLPPVSLMDMGFAVVCPLARHRRPRIRFLFIGSLLCSTLLSGPASRRVLFTLALRYDFTSIRLSKGLSPSSCRTCSAHKPEARFAVARRAGSRQMWQTPDGTCARFRLAELFYLLAASLPAACGQTPALKGCYLLAVVARRDTTN